LKTGINNNLMRDSRIARLRRDLKFRLGKNLQQIVLFGSRARGDAKPDSDYDVLVLVKDVNRSVKDAIDDIAGELLCEFGMVVSAFPTTEESVRSRRFSPLLMNVNREGVIL